MIISKPMETSRMSANIVKILNKHFAKYIRNECFDIIQIKNICNLYNNSTGKNSSITLSEINFSSPEFTKYNHTVNKNHLDILKTQEFIKKHAFFIKVMYACLKLNLEIFFLEEEFITLKNNYEIIKTLESTKKQLIHEHINILKSQYKDVSKKISDNYDDYLNDYLIKIKIIDKIHALINGLIKSNILESQDNLLSLILPYFFTYPEFIEEYN